MTNPAWAAALNRAIERSACIRNHRPIPSERTIATALRQKGFKVTRTAVQRWRHGSVPTNGLRLLPVLAEVLECEVKDLLP